MEKIKKIKKKLVKKETILYVAFGAGTIAINLGSFYIMHSLLNCDENISNLIAIILAVLFSYITNKDLVFHSEAESKKEKIKEFFRFITGRTFTIIIEFAGGLILFKTMIPEIISKAMVTVIVVILNLFISKFFTFKRKRKMLKEGESKI